MHINPTKRLSEDIFLESRFKFNELKAEIFQYQRNNCKVFQQWCAQFPNRDNVFLPIGFFKSHVVSDSTDIDNVLLFTSSGTTGQLNSRHFVTDPELYKRSFQHGITQFLGEFSEYSILALLPGYLERTGSSLVYMMDSLIKLAQPGSGFYLHNHAQLLQQLLKNESEKIPTLLIGVTHALIDFSDYFSVNSGNIVLQNTIVMETGGMKGKGKELVRAELHDLLMRNFGVNAIASEYGMTELLSQAYSKSEGRFFCPPWMQVQIQDASDPGTFLGHGKTGRICVTDLANLHSCSFIATDDLGKTYEDGSFEILGRLDFSDLRGCNLMVG